MASINGLGGNSPIQKLNVPVTPKADSTPSTASGSSRSDKLELSGASHLLAALKSNNIRADKVASVKAQIEQGTYEDDHKLDVASSRLLDDLLK